MAASAYRDDDRRRSGRPRPGRRGLITAALATLLLGLLPAAGHASTAEISGNVLVYTAAGGEANDVTVTKRGDFFLVDDAVDITGDGGCRVETATPRHAECPAAGVQTIAIDLGDETDALHIEDAAYATLVPPEGQQAVLVTAGDGNDEVTTGAGSDQVIGDDGTDTIDTAGGDDAPAGGAGNDTIDAGA